MRYHVDDYPWEQQEEWEMASCNCHNCPPCSKCIASGDCEECGERSFMPNNPNQVSDLPPLCGDCFEQMVRFEDLKNGIHEPYEARATPMAPSNNPALVALEIVRNDNELDLPSFAALEAYFDEEVAKAFGIPGLKRAPGVPVVSPVPRLCPGCGEPLHAVDIKACFCCAVLRGLPRS